MAEVKLHERTQALLDDPSLGGEDVDSKIRHLLEAEYLRQMARYRRVDRTLTTKYGMNFGKFVSRRIVAREEFSWEVEQDAMDWETAVGGIETMERKFDDLQTIDGN